MGLIICFIVHIFLLHVEPRTKLALHFTMCCRALRGLRHSQFGSYREGAQAGCSARLKGVWRSLVGLSGWGSIQPTPPPICMSEAIYRPLVWPLTPLVGNNGGALHCPCFEALPERYGDLDCRSYPNRDRYRYALHIVYTV